MFRLFLDTGFYSISFPANRQVSTARYNSPNRLFPAYFPRNAFLCAGADYPSGTIIYLCAFSVKRYSRFFLSLTELVKKGELTVEQGKVLNEELKHNIKDAIRENVTLHIVTPGKKIAARRTAAKPTIPPACSGGRSCGRIKKK